MHYTESKGILTAKNGMNLYRGCSHVCIYCDSRSRGYQFTHDFEDIEVKSNALELLEDALRRKRKKCMIGTGSMTDPYIPLERELEHVRRTLMLVEKYGFGFTVITKSDLILRDLDILKRINEKTKCVVQMTLTTFDEELCRKIEPGVCTSRRRFEVLKAMRDAGIPTVVWLCPVLPFINDTEENLRGILNYCVEAGVRGVLCFGMGLTLRDGNREYFYEQLDRLFPGMKGRYMKEFGNGYVCSSTNNGSLMKLFHRTCEKAGIMHNTDEIFKYLNEFQEKQVGSQLSFL